MSVLLSRTWIVGVLLSVAVILTGCHPKPKARVVLESVNDNVFALKSDGKTQVPSGHTLPMSAGEGVDVDDTGLALLHFPDYLLVRIFRDSSLRVEEMAEPNAPPAVRLRMEGGTALVDVDPSAKFVSIENDVAVVTSMGTSFWIHVRPADQATWVMVREGKVVLRAGRSTVAVKPGFQSWVIPGEQIQKPVPNFREYVPQDILPSMEELTAGSVKDSEVFQEKEVPVGRATPSLPPLTLTPTSLPSATPSPTVTPTPTLTFEIALPDLVVTEIGMVGGNRIRCAYENAGEAKVPKVRVWISVFVNGERVARSTVWTPMAPGQGSWFQTRPLEIHGMVDVRCVIDSDNSVVESDERNNTLQKYLACFPAYETFAGVQREMELGCGKAPASKVRSAWQPFENGYMIWRGDTRKIYVLVSKAGYSTPLVPPGRWVAYDDKWQEGMPEISCGAAEDQEFPIVRGFGYLWCHNDGVRSTLGNSIEGERGDEQTMQAFERGWAMEVRGWWGVVALSESGKWMFQPWVR